jgi:hypothetical protein
MLTGEAVHICGEDGSSMLVLSGRISNSVYVLTGEAVQFCGEDGSSMPVLTVKISNSVYLQEKLTSFVEGFLTVYTYRRSWQVLWCGWIINARPIWKDF